MKKLSSSVRSILQPAQGLAVSALLVLLAAPVQAQSVPGSSAVYPDSQGEEVAAVQQRLVELGYYQGPITGYFDPATQAAVTQFQQANGLDADGIVGSATQRALYESSVAPQTTATGAASYPSYLQLNDAGDQVLALQQQLVQQGYFTGTPSGIFDEQTQMAVMNFQRARGLSVDGIVGSATETALTGSAAPVETTAATPTYTANPTPNDGLMQMGDAGTEVSNLQTQLQALGYYSGPISGSFGSQTQAALIAFQQAQGLTADGIAGPQVTAALSTATQPQTTAGVTQPAQTVQPVQTVTPSVAPVVVSPAPAVTVPPLTSTAQPVPTIGQPTVQVAPMPAPSLSPQPVQTQSMMPPAQPLPPAAGPAQSQSPGRFTVLDLQRRLQLNGFNSADMSGVFDSGTQSAIMQAQQAYGLSQSDLFER